MGERAPTGAAEVHGMANLASYHRDLFNWHSRTFYPFRRRLKAIEKVYLETCFGLAAAFEETSEGGYEHFSYYTYSHRVKGDQANSSRMAYGSVLRPKEALAAARPVLAMRGLTLPDGLEEGNEFYGLGWDLEEELFKVYFRTLDWRRLPASLSDLVVDYNWNDHRPEALLSFTYRQKELFERKVYLYPSEAPSQDGVRGQARMITDGRGEVVQDDLAQSGVIPYDLNETGQAILEKYRSIGESLDTIAYNDSQDFTMYFP